MKVLVTGGAGFIGSNLVDALLATGNQVTIVDNLSTGRFDNVNSLAKFYLEDITSERLAGILKMEQPDLVFHHAAQIDVQVSLKNPSYDAKVNIMGTINVLDACVQSGVDKVIYASSAAAFGEPEYIGIDEKHKVDPISNYGISKHTPEHYLRVYHAAYGLKYTALRYANVFGPRQDPKGEGGVISIFIDRFLNGQRPVIFGDGKQTRDFIYVKDIVKANLAAIDKGHGEILNIGTGRQTSINELLGIIKRIINSQITPIYVSPRKGDILHSYFDNSFAQKVLGWEPTYTLEQSLNETVEYYREIYSLGQEVAVTI